VIYKKTPLSFHPSTGTIVRKHEPIWLRLKLKGTVSLAAPPSHHRRIVLAVRKLKTQDAGWKYQCLEDRKRYKLMDNSDASLLTFTLVITDTLSYANLTVHDL